MLPRSASGRAVQVGTILAIVALAAGLVLWARPTPTRPVTLFYYDPARDRDAQGNIACSAAGLVPVQRTITLSENPTEDALQLLLAGQLTDRERAQGVTTEFPLLGVHLVGTSLKDGVLTLTFEDPHNRTSGGSCRVAVLWAQIETTAKQFPGVLSVRFMPEELFQP